MYFAERPHPVKPETHLKSGNLFFENTQDIVNFIDPNIGEKETRLMHESNKDTEEEKKRRKELIEKQRKDEEMKILVSKLEDLKTSPLEIPEYKDAYKANSNSEISNSLNYRFIDSCSIFIFN